MSPTLGIKGAAQVRRKRVLTDTELAKFLKWLRHHYDSEARDWLQRWANYLDALTARNVVPLRAA